MSRARIAVAALSISAAAFATWQASEGFAPRAEIPTQGDVPTIGYGSTKYEDGSPVQMGDTITRARAVQLARNLASKDEAKFRASLPGVQLYQEEYDTYLDFTGQYGIGNWRQSSMRGYLLDGKYATACKSLLRYRFAAGYDCSTLVDGKPNRRCWGVWTRQKQRFDKCMGAQ